MVPCTVDDWNGQRRGDYANQFHCTTYYAVCLFKRRDLDRLLQDVNLYMAALRSFGIYVLHCWSTAQKIEHGMVRRLVLVFCQKMSIGVC